MVEAWCLIFLLEQWIVDFLKGLIFIGLNYYKRHSDLEVYL